jgi:hypothetical protein
MRLLEQNMHYQTICEDMLKTKRTLEKENEILNNALKGKTKLLDNLRHNSQQLKFAYQEENEEIKKRIDQYIQDIDTSIEWLKEL